MKLFLLIPVILFSGCTAQDVDATFGAIDHGVSTYRNARAAYYGQPYYAP